MNKYFHYRHEIFNIFLTKIHTKCFSVFIDKEAEIPEIKLSFYDERQFRLAIITRELDKNKNKKEDIMDSFARL